MGKGCNGCIYHKVVWGGDHLGCCYAIDTDQLRGCPVEECDKYTPRKRKPLQSSSGKPQPKPKTKPEHKRGGIPASTLKTGCNKHPDCLTCPLPDCSCKPTVITKYNGGFPPYLVQYAKPGEEIPEPFDWDDPEQLMLYKRLYGRMRREKQKQED